MWDVAKAIAADSDLIRALEDMHPAMELCADVIARAITSNFASQSAAGDPWEPLAESTKADRRRKGFGEGPILERTGNLKDASTKFREVSSHSAEVGFPEGHPYAKFHMSEAPRSKIPLRDALILDEKHLRECDASIVEYLSKHHG